jgi:arachidonate 15-lipoxygenase
VTTIVFRITGYHAVINYGGYDFFAWPATLPTARWGPAPAPSDGGDAILKVLPPLGLAEHTLDLMLPQRELRLNHLGAYPARWFADPRVAPLLVTLHAGLEAAESEIARRDAARPWSFPYLRPSRIAQSIHV